MNKKAQVIFTSIPFTDTTRPLMAPGALKSIAIKNGYSSVALDLNAKYLNIITNHPKSNLVLEFFKNGVLDPAVAKFVENLLNKITDEILQFDPQVVGLSVFTYDCRISAHYISWLLKRKKANIKVLCGGSGLYENFSGKSIIDPSLIENSVIDLCIRGDGEKPLEDFLQKNCNTEQIKEKVYPQLTNEELNNLPIPDYEDYDFSFYPRFEIPIQGSRGCVRNCTFCDVHVHWKKFTWKSGEKIFNEMLEFYTKHEYKSFHFTDSLVNGNMQEYRKMISLLSEFNKTHADDPITWTSEFIIKPMNQFTEEDWKLTKLSGCSRVVTGIESLSEKARFHMGKKFTNEDIEFALQMCKKYDIQILFLMIVGYITETEQDIIDAQKWWEKHVNYKDIIRVNVGTPLGILKNTPLSENFHSLGLDWTGDNDQDWKNENSDPATRVRWYKTISKTLTDLGFVEYHPHDNHFIIERIQGAYNELV